ncbi:MAG: hypothetical protein IT428_16825 [Planctomycetaceae bacterium]|nr:hypothetical protein [Planctomycetaceae bacterium]
MGYTLSTTHPYEEVDFIREYSTVYQEGAGLKGKVVSTGRRIPRNQVRPVKFTFGNSIMNRGERVMAERFYYVPPSTASDWEKRETR